MDVNECKYRIDTLPGAGGVETCAAGWSSRNMLIEPDKRWWISLAAIQRTVSWSGLFMSWTCGMWLMRGVEWYLSHRFEHQLVYPGYLERMPWINANGNGNAKCGLRGRRSRETAIIGEEFMDVKHGQLLYPKDMKQRKILIHSGSFQGCIEQFALFALKSQEAKFLLCLDGGILL